LRPPARMRTEHEFNIRHPAKRGREESLPPLQAQDHRRSSRESTWFARKGLVMPKGRASGSDGVLATTSGPSTLETTSGHRQSDPSSQVRSTKTIPGSLRSMPSVERPRWPRRLETPDNPGGRTTDPMTARLRIDFRPRTSAIGAVLARTPSVSGSSVSPVLRSPQRAPTPGSLRPNEYGTVRPTTPPRADPRRCGESPPVRRRSFRVRGNSPRSSRKSTGPDRGRLSQSTRPAASPSHAFSTTAPPQGPRTAGHLGNLGNLCRPHAASGCGRGLGPRTLSASPPT
jgi:hypothetical protein